MPRPIVLAYTLVLFSLVGFAVSGLGRFHETIPSAGGPIALAVSVGGGADDAAMSPRRASETQTLHRPGRSTLACRTVVRIGPIDVGRECADRASGMASAN